MPDDSIRTRPPDRTPLEWATTDELAEELFRRCPALVLSYLGPQAANPVTFVRGDAAVVESMIRQAISGFKAGVRARAARDRRPPPAPPSPPPHPTDLSEGGGA